MNVNDDGNVKPPKEEIAGWFPKTSQDALRILIEANSIKSVIEVGVFVGKSAAFFAGFPCVEKVFAVDPFKLWQEGMEENGQAIKYGNDFFWKFKENMEKEGVQHKIIPLKLTSFQAAAFFHKADRFKFLSLAEQAIQLEGGADLIYIDANHDYESVKEDIMLWTPFAKKFICGDDYDEHWPGVKKAVDELYPQAEIFGNLWIAPIMSI